MEVQAKRSTNLCRCVTQRSYLLRLWRTGEPGVFTWQASLQIPETGERLGFASLEELFAYLMDRTTGPESLKGESK